MLRYLLRPVLLTLLLAAARAHAAPDCTPLAPASLPLPAAGLVLVGELHGNQEMPRAFVRLVCSALQSGRAVAVGLELPAEQAQPLRTYLDSDGSPAAQRSLTATAYWQQGRDGRASLAYLDMIEALRQLQGQHARLSVFVLYEDLESLADLRQRADRIMADRIRREVLARPDALVMTLSGNYHAKLRLSGHLAQLRMPDGMPLPQPMGAWLADLQPFALNLTSTGGTSWNCISNVECGAHAAMQDDSGPLFSIARTEEAEPAYSAALNVGMLTASAPAATAR
jgi:hypothetical protein